MNEVTFALIGGGSAIGAVARYTLGVAISKVNNSLFPWGTWIVNMTGTFLLGLFFQQYDVMHPSPDWWAFLGTGFCGGFTTFSTMSLEAVALFRRHIGLGFLYLASSLLFGFILAWLTHWWS